MSPEAPEGEREALRLFQSVQYLAKSLDRAKSRNDIADAVLGALHGGIRDVCAVAALLAEDGTALEALAPGVWRGERSVVPIAFVASHPIALAFREQRTVIYPDRAALIAAHPDPALYDLDGRPTEVLCATHMRGNLRSFGAIGLLSRTPRTFTSLHLSFLETVATLAAQACERVYAEANREAAPPAPDVAMEELKRSKERLAQAQRVARVGSWDFDLRTGKGEWSEEMFRLLEFDPADGIPNYERFKARIHPDDVARHAAMETTAMTTGEPRDFDLRVVYSDGRQGWLHALGRSEKDETGKVVRTFGTLTDITERKTLEQRLRESEKMEGIGRLAGGIAHDFNNLLCVIMGYVELIEEELPGESPLVPQIRLIGDAADRASNLTRQLLSFARRQPSEPKVVSVNAEIVQILEILRPLIGEDVLLATHLSPGIGNVRIDSHHLEQIIVNLVLNARSAWRRGHSRQD